MKDLEMDTKKITIKQAYAATYIFLRKFYLRDGKPENLALLLTSMQLTKDGQSLDLAAWFDWMNAIDEALENESVVNFRGDPPTP